MDLALAGQKKISCLEFEMAFFKSIQMVSC